MRRGLSLKHIILMIMAMGLLFAGAFSLTGCKFTEWLVTDTGQTVVQEAGELAGMVIGFENQGDIEKMIEEIDVLLLEPNEALKEIALQEAYKYVYAKYGHNVQTAYLMSKAEKLIGLVTNGDKLEFLAGYKVEALDSFLVAFRNGLSMATPRYKEFVRK